MINCTIHLENDTFLDVHTRIGDFPDTSRPFTSLSIGDASIFVQPDQEDMMLDWLEKAASFYRRRKNKRNRGSKQGCTVTLKLSVSGGESYPSAVPLATFLETQCADSKLFAKAMNGNTLDHIYVTVNND